MRRLLLLTLLPLLCCPAAPARQKDDRKREGLVGPVRSVSGETVTDFEITGEAGRHQSRRLLQAVTFNEKGGEVSRLFYDEDGRAVWTQTHTYDAAGRLAESSLTDTENHLLLQEVYKYGADSRLSEKLIESGSVAGPLKETFSYDARGRLAQITESSRGKRGSRRKYTYDERGRVVAVAYYWGGGEPGIAPRNVVPFTLCPGAHKVTYRYGEAAFPVEVQCVQRDGQVWPTRTYAYNDRGDVAEETESSSLTSTRRTNTYEYDARGNWTKRETRFVYTYSPKIIEHHTRENHLQVTRRTITYY